MVYIFLWVESLLLQHQVPGRKARDGGHGADQGVEEARPHRGPHVPDGQAEPRGCALDRGVSGQGQVSLR